MNVKKPLVMKEKATEQPASNDTQRPKNPLANVLATKPKPLSDDVSATRPKNLPANLRPIEGYIIEIDGKFKSEFESSEAAMKAGLELKKKYPHIQVKVYDAKERTWTPFELSEQSEKKAESAS